MVRVRRSTRLLAAAAPAECIGADMECPKCRLENPPSAARCYCGYSFGARPTAARGSSTTQARSAKGQGALAGCIAGWGVSGCLIPLGILLCFTGIGAIVGVPMILGGVMAPLLGPLMGLGALKGRCPWCGTGVTSGKSALGFDCPACKKRIVIRGKTFVRID